MISIEEIVLVKLLEQAKDVKFCIRMKKYNFEILNFGYATFEKFSALW